MLFTLYIKQKKSCPKDGENYEKINTAIENLINAHNNIFNKIRE